MDDVVLCPINDNVVVVPAGPEAVTKGGIHLPDISHLAEKPRKGLVIAVGPGEWFLAEGVYCRKPMSVSKGDVVYFAKWSGNEIEENGAKLLVMPESQILAKVK